MIFDKLLEASEAKDLPLRMLAHLGDAVFELYEREREVMTASDAQKLHKNVVRRVNAVSQAAILEALMDHLFDAEKDIVRRARNLKVTGSRKVDQHTYRHATALEALVGYLYLTDKARLTEVLDRTL